MKKTLWFAVLAALLASGSTLACEYKPGETKFLDYATCLYPTEEVVVAGLAGGFKLGSMHLSRAGIHASEAPGCHQGQGRQGRSEHQLPRKYRKPLLPDEISL